MSGDNDSLAQYSQFDQRYNDGQPHRGNTEQDGQLSQRPDTAAGVGAEISGNRGGGPSNLKQINEITTLDLMYSFDPQKTTFSEDTVRRMTYKLKLLKRKSREQLDCEEEGIFSTLLGHMRQGTTNHIDFYAQRQLSSLMKSLFVENKIISNNYSIIDNSKELVKIPQNHTQIYHHHQSSQQDLIVSQDHVLEQSNQKTLSDGNHDDGQSNQQQQLIYKTMETINPSKVNMQMKALFKDYNQQYKSDLKFTLNSCFYKYLSFSFHKKHFKLSLEMKKLQMLGEIGGLSFLIYEMVENDGKLMSDQIFQLIYECYDKLFVNGQRREVLLKFTQLKHAKRVNQQWLSFWRGVINKCRHSMTYMQCFREIEYFKESLETAESIYEETKRKEREIKEDYDNIKKIALDYSYQVGKIKAFQRVIKIYKNEREQITEQIKIRIRELRDKMESFDVKMIQLFYSEVQIKRYQSLYFTTLGELSFSRCVEKGIDSQCVFEYMLIHLFQINAWSYIIASVRINPHKQNHKDNQELDKILLHILKFQRVKEIDEKIMQDIKEDGVMGYDKFKAYTQRMAEEEEKMSNHLKSLNSQNPASGNPQLEKKTTIRANSLQNGANLNVQNPQQQKQKAQQNQQQQQQQIQQQQTQKTTQIMNQETLDLVSQMLEQEYSLGGKQSRISQFVSFINTQRKDITQEIITDALSNKQFQDNIQVGNEKNQSFRNLNDFIELDLHNINIQSKNSQIFKMIGQYFFINKVKQELTPNHAINEKKSMAHNLCEHFLKGLGQMKSTRFQKQFKEARIEALTNFVESLNEINKYGTWNNFELNSIDLPLDISIEQCFQAIVCLELFIKEKEKEALWRDLTYKQDISRSSTLNAGGVLGGSSMANETDNWQRSMTQIAQSDLGVGLFDYENSQEYKTFTNLFHLMKGYQKIKLRVKEKIFRPFYKLYEYQSLKLQKYKQILTALLETAEQEDSNGNQQDNYQQNAIQNLEQNLTEQIFAIGDEEEEFPALLEQFNNDKYQLYEKRKAKGLENFILGAQQYLAVFNEGEEKSDIIVKLQKELQRILEQVLQENKGIKYQTIQLQFKENAEKLLKKIMKQEILNSLLTKVKKNNKIDKIIGILKDQLIDINHQSNKVEKAIKYLQSNYLDDQEDFIIQQMGARSMNYILSGQIFIEGFDQLANQGLRHDESVAHMAQEAQLNQKVLKFLSAFTNKLSSIEERINTVQILRNDQVFGFMVITNQKLIHKRDAYRLKEQYDEGLKHLINIFEIYKTPLSHYQKSYERVCRFISKEIISRIVESDEGYLKYLFFELISKKGSAIFKSLNSKLEQAFNRIEIDETIRLDIEKVKIQAKRDLDLQMRIFKEFIDLEENSKIAQVKQQQSEHQNFRLMQELAALILLIRIFYIKLEQEENAYAFSINDGYKKMNSLQ